MDLGMTSGRQIDPIGSRPKSRDESRWSALSGPRAGFLAAIVIGFGALGLARVSLSADAVMPVVATLFIVMAVVVAAIAWTNRGMDPAQVTYTDVAGALTLIGFFAAATIDPDQLMRLLDVDPQE
jgi:hypothetical protein